MFNSLSEDLWLYVSRQPSVCIWAGLKSLALFNFSVCSIFVMPDWGWLSVCIQSLWRCLGVRSLSKWSVVKCFGSYIPRLRIRFLFQLVSVVLAAKDSASGRRRIHDYKFSIIIIIKVFQPNMETGWNLNYVAIHHKFGNVSVSDLNKGTWCCPCKLHIRKMSFYLKRSGPCCQTCVSSFAEIIWLFFLWFLLMCRSCSGERIIFHEARIRLSETVVITQEREDVWGLLQLLVCCFL